MKLVKGNTIYFPHVKELNSDIIDSIINAQNGEYDQIDKINIPAELEEIPFGIFEHLKSLSKISVNTNNNVFSSKDGVLFDKKKEKLLCYPCNKQDITYTIPEDVKKISSFDSNAPLDSDEKNILDYGLGFKKNIFLKRIILNKYLSYKSNSITQYSLEGCNPDIKIINYMARIISDDFISNLKDGCLKSFTDIVKKDNSLILCFRKDSINIYYINARNLLKINNTTHYYKCEFNLNYSRSLDNEKIQDSIKSLDENTKIDTPNCKTKHKYLEKYFDANTKTYHGKKIKNNYTFLIPKGNGFPNDDQPRKILNTLKDFIISYPRDEIEFRAQNKLFINRFDATITDGYIILDKEYNITNEYSKLEKPSNIDLIAIKIENSKIKNITLIEVKSKYSACVGDTASLLAHKNDYDNVIKNNDIKLDIINSANFALETYNELGLLKQSYKIDEKIDFVKLFVFTDEITDKKSLEDYLKDSKDDLKAFQELYAAGETKFIKL